MVPAFRPKSSMQAPSAAEYSQKCTPHPTLGTRSYSAGAWPDSKLRWNSSSFMALLCQTGTIPPQHIERALGCCAYWHLS